MSSNDSLYSKSQLDLLVVSVYFFSITKSLLCFVGIVLNLLLIYVTVRAKWLHGVCNILLALYDASIIPFLVDVPFYLVQVVAGVSSMQMFDCFLIQMVPLFTFCASFPLMLCIAIDRFLGVFIPIRYKSVKKSKLIGAALVLSSIYASFYLFAGYQNARQPNKRTACTTIAPLSAYVNTLAKTNFLLEFIEILVYICLWLYMNHLDKKLRKENRNSVVSIRRLFKSLFTISLVHFVGWSTNSISMTILDLVGVSSSPAKSDQMLYYFVTSSLNYLSYLSSSSNAIFLYSFSQEYQRAFDEFLPGWKEAMKRVICCRNNTTIAPQNVILVEAKQNDAPRKPKRTKRGDN
ncbi:hypothetical protein niasHS_012956 [Heterodera schachtii]|uniref:G-protein coupled receptors family 1 profile domain-containing protein n=1 Tax=Heterodera schachtii TaxID=97005 RepID=A0ABD2ICK7_HETSC